MTEEVETPVAETLLTVADLPVPAGKVAAERARVKQYIEPERDGEPWLSRAEAEHYAVKALLPYFVGLAGKSIKFYQLDLLAVTEDGAPEKAGTDILSLRIGS